MSRAAYEIQAVGAVPPRVLEDFPGVNDLLEYEARLNYILPRYKDPVI